MCNLVMTFEIQRRMCTTVNSMFRGSVKMKSIHELEWGSRCVGCDISWWKLCKDVSASKCVPSVVLSSFHQDEDLVLSHLELW